MKTSFLSKSVKLISNYPSLIKCLLKLLIEVFYFSLLKSCIIENIVCVSSLKFLLFYFFLY